MAGIEALVSNALLIKRGSRNEKQHYAVMDILRNGASFAGRKCAFIKSSAAAVKNAKEKTYVNIIV